MKKRKQRSGKGRVVKGFTLRGFLGPKAAWKKFWDHTTQQ